MSAGSDEDARARLERDYLAGSISADEYTRLRRLSHQGSWGTAEIDEQRPPSGRSADPVTGARLASWGRRAAALLLDWVILFAALVVVTLFTLAIDDSATQLLVLYAALLVLPSAYQWLMVGRSGQTLGKMALGVKVVRAEDAGRVTYARAAGRVASTWVLGIVTLPLLVAYLWPLWDRRNQTIYDKMVNTIVVRVESA